MTWQNKYFRGITLKRWYLKYAVMKPCDGRYTRVVYRIPLTLKVTVGATVLNLTPENLGLLEKQRLLADGGGGGEGGEGAALGASTHFDPVNNLVFRCSTVFELSSAVT